ncbi:protein kinase [Acidobacteriota bacterium]
MFKQGQVVGKYKVLELVGRGGFGSVFLAEDTWLKLPVALKVPHRQEADFDYLLKEPRLLATLDHPNIVRVMTCEQIEDTFFLVMEYVDGRSLEAIIEEDGPVDLERFWIYLKQICCAVDYAHKQSVLHRDLRPANLLVAPDGTLKITDFGIARLLDRSEFARTRIGSPPYMAPEQFRGRTVFQSDIYSIGVVMYELLTGTLPFYDVRANQQPDGRPIPPHVKNPRIPRIVSDTIMKAMALASKDRHQHALEIIEDLKRPEPVVEEQAEMESMEDIKKRLQVRVETPAAFCWNCGRPLSKKSRMCPHCGEVQEV